MPQYARCVVDITKAMVIIIEYMRIQILLLFLEAFHKAKILAMDAAAKIMVAKNKENDHVVNIY